MNLKLTRLYLKLDYTIGKLYIDGSYLCDTLEDEVRPPGIKIYGKTAIPDGTYKVEMTESPKFNRVMPILINVPNFEGVRIHPGNSATDTEGCILVGKNSVKGGLTESRFYSNMLNNLLSQEKENIQIEIV